MPTVNGKRIPDFWIQYQKALPTLASTTTITAATNATPIVITDVAHGYSNGDILFITAVGGNTNANGFRIVALAATDTFAITNLDGTNVSGNAAYTSGGTAQKFSSTPVIASKDCWFDKVRINNSTGTDQTFTLSTNESPTPTDKFTNYSVPSDTVTLEIDDTAQPEFCSGGAVIYASGSGLNCTVNAWRKP